MKNRIITLTVTLLLGAIACSDEYTENYTSPTQEPIAFSGLMTRAVATTPEEEYKLRITAQLDGGVDYIHEAPATFATTGNITFDNNKQFYYPLGNANLSFFAHTGGEAKKNAMHLTAGQNKNTSDALLSNGWDGSLPATSTGTVGSSSTPLDKLTFRHVMTRLEVIVEIDNSTHPDIVDPAPQKIKIQFNEGYAQGTLPFTATDGNATKEGNEKYTIQKGINYLVPTGATITQMNSLEIDTYKATPADLKKFTITTGSGDPLVLTSGAAYTLTFKIKRLQLQGIELTLGKWDEHPLNDNGSVSYKAKELTLSLGAYTDKDINKVLLYDNDGKLFSGDTLLNDRDNRTVKYIALPSAVAKVDLYTTQGLLIHTETGITYTAEGNGNPATLTLPNLSKSGMLLENTALPNATDNPYLITTPVQFYKLRNDLAAHYRQLVDININNLRPALFSSFGDITGSYDGNGKHISNLTGSGLFTSNSGTLKHIRIGSGKITGSGSTAGAICCTNKGTILACINQAQIEGVTNTGGICGLNEGTITACSNTGNIIGTSTGNTGGICGENTNTAADAITACVSTGMLQNGKNLAGICGLSCTATGVIKNCYWLTGTAERTIGTPEVGTNGQIPSQTDSVADLSPDRMRETETITSLNGAIPATFSKMYKFSIDYTTTGSTWPMPIKL